MCSLTVHVSVLSHGVDLLVGQDLHVLTAGSTVQLVDPDQPAAHAVRHFALLAYMLREIRRGLIGYLSKIRCYHNHQCVYIRFVFAFFFFTLFKYLALELNCARDGKNDGSGANSVSFGLLVGSD